jgi:hypothetical protein
VDLDSCPQSMQALAIKTRSSAVTRRLALSPSGAIFLSPRDMVRIPKSRLRQVDSTYDGRLNGALGTSYPIGVMPAFTPHSRNARLHAVSSPSWLPTTPLLKASREAALVGVAGPTRRSGRWAKRRPLPTKVPAAPSRLRAKCGSSSRSESRTFVRGRKSRPADTKSVLSPPDAGPPRGVR